MYITKEVLRQMGFNKVAGEWVCNISPSGTRGFYAARFVPDGSVWRMSIDGNWSLVETMGEVIAAAYSLGLEEGKKL